MIEPDNQFKIDVEPIYTSISSNRNENNLACRGQYLLYSRNRCPVLYHVGSKTVTSQLRGHDDDVNGQSFAIKETFADNHEHIISTSHDKTAIIWEITTDDEDPEKLRPGEEKILFRLRSPDDSVFTSRCTFRNSNQQFTTITTSLDGNLFLWSNDQLVQTLPIKYCCFDLKLTRIKTAGGQSFTFVFLAGSDNQVHVLQLCDSHLEHLFDLSGFNDWIKCIDIRMLTSREDEFLLATACQDCLIRVWDMKITSQSVNKAHIRTKASRPLIQESGNDNGEYRLTATLETVLSGHDGIVHGLSWFQKQQDPVLQLVSCSEDKTIVIWRSTVANDTKDHQHEQQVKKYEQSPASAEVWREIQRVGETGETNLPFLGVCLSEDETTFYALSLKGAIHSWYLKGQTWQAGESITGHFDVVTDLSWEKSGAYLLSSSLDKTCRLHAISSLDNKWHELTRPQVHGHELNCVTSLNFSKFASGAEEKTIRTFGATRFFIRNFRNLAKMYRLIPSDLELESQTEEVPAHAQLPALGLSNKGASSPYDIGGGGGDSKDKRESANGDWNEISQLVKELARLEHLESLPFEEILLQSTLWWETNKLFGHCNELHALASDSSGTYLASASKANRSDLASVIVWETQKFRKVATIEHHSLTITRLKFSPDDKYLLSVSRDRTWCLSERAQQLRNAYRKILGTNAKTNAVHERIIWDCCWTHDSRYFLTVSRDKRVILWSIEELIQNQGQQQQQISYISMKQFDCPIMASDSPLYDCISSLRDRSQTYLFALGFENGSLGLYSVSLQGSSTTTTSNDLRNDNCGPWQCLGLFANHHQLPIRRLTFHPKCMDEDHENDDPTHGMEVDPNSSAARPRRRILAMLASGGDDCIVKLTRILISSDVEQTAVSN